MKRLFFSSFVLCSLSVVAGGDALTHDLDKPVWTLEVIKVIPAKYGPVLGDLDEQWMRVREEAKRQGVVLSYHRISDGGIVAPGHQQYDPASIVLLTEYKDIGAYISREKTFASIRERLPHNTPGVLRPGDSYTTADGHIFVEVPAETSAQFKLLAQQ